MSLRYPGGVLSATPPTASVSSAPGIWAETDVMQNVASGNWPRSAGAPTIGTATAGNAQATVTFTAPSDVGTGTLTYTVTSSPGAITATGSASPITVTGLTNGTAYTFTVTASTPGGTSPASAPSNSVTPVLPPVYIEDVYSTYLYTGNGSTQTITNGIDLAGKGGLVWFKARSAADPHALVDTTRGTRYTLASSSTAAQVDQGDPTITALSNGFSINGGYSNINSVRSFVSWTFRKQPKFFDVVTYTGNGASIQSIAHNLASTPGCVIIKRTDSTSDWIVLHRDAPGPATLNSTAAAGASGWFWNSTEFRVGSAYGWTQGTYNVSGATYVAYVYAHNAGGFGLTGTDNVISCGSFTTDVNGSATVSLGYEPQWFLVKQTSAAENWFLYDTMRGFANLSDQVLFPNLSNAESNFTPTTSSYFTPTATGVNAVNWFGANSTYIYIAIRRGPMKVPTGGTSVYYTDTSRSAVSGSTPSWVSGFVTDMAFGKIVGNVANMNIASRLTGTGQLFTNTTSAEGTDATYTWDFMQGWGSAGSASSTFASWMFRRAPGFFDVVCYTGTGAATTVTHNLQAVPELMIVKSRSLAQDGAVYTASSGNGYYLRLFSASGDSGNTATAFWNSTTPTSSVFSVGTANNVNGSGQTYVAYLFATCAGVSKVGSYTGTGATQTISCGFTGGARFVLIKKSTSTAPDKGWYVWDTARGMVSGTDPYLLLNTTAAEVNADNIYTTTGGFQIVSTDSGINASGVSYIFLAIA